MGGSIEEWWWVSESLVLKMDASMKEGRLYCTVGGVFEFYLWGLVLKRGGGLSV